MLSRWRMQEQHGGALGLSQVQYVFLELPKYRSGDDPQGTIDRWAYFFREAKNLEVVPPALSETPYREALEVARMAGFSAGELDLYDRAKIAEQDARGALSLAERQGREAGRRSTRGRALRRGPAKSPPRGCAKRSASFARPSRSSSTRNAKPPGRPGGRRAERVASPPAARAALELTRLMPKSL